MSQHGGQLILIFQSFEQAGVDTNASTRQGKGVDLIRFKSTTCHWAVLF